MAWVSFRRHRSHDQQQMITSSRQAMITSSQLGVHDEATSTSSVTDVT